MKSQNHSKTFLTTLKDPALESIDGLYDELRSCVTNLESSMNEVIKKREEDFFQIHKFHMEAVKSDLNQLKDQISANELRRKRDAELRSLEKERNWFRNEAVKLDEICKTYKQRMEEWKTKAKVLEETQTAIEHKLAHPLKPKPCISHTTSIGIQPNLSPPPPQVSLDHKLELALLHKENARLRRDLDRLKLTHSSFISEKVEFEEFFYSCVEAVKKDIVTRRLPRSRSSSNIRSSNQVSFTHFTHTDKKKVLDLLVSNQYITHVIKSLVVTDPRPKHRPTTGSRRIFK